MQHRNRLHSKTTLLAIFFMACLINTVLEIYREISIITNQIPSSLYFIKLFLSLPAVIITMFLIQKALNWYNFSQIFDFLILFFCFSFFITGFLLLPFKETIQKGSMWVTDIVCDSKLATMGLLGLLPFLYMFGEWISTFTYIISEMWSSVLLGYALYTLANYSCTEEEIKEIVPLFSNITAFSMILSCILLVTKDNISNFLPTKWILNPGSVFYGAIFICSLLIYVFKKLLMLESNLKRTKTETDKETTTISSLLNSRLLRNMCVTVLCYSINAGYIDLIFKKGLSTGSQKYNQLPSKYSQKYILTMLLVTSFASLFYNTFVRRHIKLLRIHIPLLASPLSNCFFNVLLAVIAFYNMHDKEENSMINFENWCSAIGFAFSKITKYALFDPAKEMLSMRIPAQYRYKHKSVYDGICLKLGKSLVSLYGTLLTFLGYSDIKQVSTLTTVLLITINIVWIQSVYYLSYNYSNAISKNKELDIDDGN